MILSKRGLLLVAVLTLVVTLIISIPARVAYQWASPPGLAVSGIHGTVWRGEADAVAAYGIVLRDVSWRITPLQLFTGSASYRVQGAPDSGFLEGNVGVTVGGTVKVSDLTASLPLNIFAQALNIRGLQGEASVQFDRLQLRDGLPVAADGTVQVNNLVAPRLSRDSIGGYRAEFFTQTDSVSASVEDTDGAVGLAGSLEINDDRSYRFLGQVVAKPNTPASLRQQLQYLGSANERGMRELRLEGSL
ncbi:MAG: type II secretion system protein N [Gammaproteobacteria bacterium]|nr:type II secretion system protein N [Gammaproteobacteria bacterium]